MTHKTGLPPCLTQTDNGLWRTSIGDSIETLFCTELYCGAEIEILRGEYSPNQLAVLLAGKCIYLELDNSLENKNLEP